MRACRPVEKIGFVFEGACPNALECGLVVCL